MKNARISELRDGLSEYLARVRKGETVIVADALQLAAALSVCAEHPEQLPFVCLDDRLREAARREGFPVLPA